MCAVVQVPHVSSVDLSLLCSPLQFFNNRIVRGIHKDGHLPLIEACYGLRDFSALLIIAQRIPFSLWLNRLAKEQVTPFRVVYKAVQIRTKLYMLLCSCHISTLHRSLHRHSSQTIVKTGIGEVSYSA